MAPHNRKIVLSIVSALALIFLVLALAPTDAVEKPTTSTRSCVTDECHTSYAQTKYPHAPVAQGVCKFCHRTLDKSRHTFQLFRQGGELCLHCHHDLSEQKNLHEPLEKGQCIKCHNPHGADSPYLIPTAKTSDLCLSCHQDVLKNKKHLHGPLVSGDCTVCHNAHSSDHEKLLVEQSNELCYLCHETTKKELEKFTFVHQPVKDQQCIQCHDPHGAANKMSLRQNIPDLCLSCHEEIDKIMQSATNQHSALYLKNGCVNCHTPHASSIRFGLKATPMNLCFSCHDKEIIVDENKTITNIKDLIENKEFLHGPVKQENCNACHAIHGSDTYRLLAQEFPAGFYSPFEIENYRLCFSCHPESRVLDQKTSELTDFRNGDQNLHFLHVNKPQRGRTCRACHSIHASDRPKHMREDVPYGKWDIPIRYEKTETGGSCRPGCHLPLSYDRENPVSYEKSDTTAKPEEKKPEEKSDGQPSPSDQTKEPPPDTPDSDTTPSPNEKPEDPNSPT